MGRRSYAMRRYRRSSGSDDNAAFIVLLVLLGFCTWGIAWLAIPALLSTRRHPQRSRKRTTATCRTRSTRIEHEPGEWVTTEQYRRPWPPTLT